ncbi:hypothetical protein [Burkholderia sp. S-53]|uniref:hypothetical protein n=1 Tax=Burkholderia sp. S-53 TaxID=2906514 RepID=UPI00399A21C6
MSCWLPIARGLLSLDNLEAIEAIRVNGRPLEFILAVPACRYGDFDELLAESHARLCASAPEESSTSSSGKAIG